VSSLIRGPLPSGSNGPPVYDVVPEQDESEMDLTILGEYVLSSDCHWVVNEAWPKGRTRSCTKHQGDCEHCRKQRNQWYGWLAAYCHRRRVRVVLRLGKESVANLASTLQPKEKPRGRRYEVKRKTAGGTSALVFRPSDREPMVPLMQAHDPHETACRVLGCKELPGYTYRAQEVREDTQ
jgi:hypothetical protein